MVVVVIGIMSGLAVMAIGGNAEREFRRDTARLQQLLTMAMDEAAYAGEELGFWIEADGQAYEFLRFDTTTLAWKPYAQDGFGRRESPDGHRLELVMDGDPVNLQRLYKELLKLDELPDDKEDTGRVPALVFFSDGQYTPFELRLQHRQDTGLSATLSGDGLGPIREVATDGQKKRGARRD